MKLGNTAHAIGRYIVDIDGCLRTTDQRYLTPADVLALSGRTHADRSVVQIVGGEDVLLTNGEWAELNEEVVAFFHTFEGRLFCGASHRARFGTPMGRPLQMTATMAA